MPRMENEWWDTSIDPKREVDGDHVGQPRPTGVLGPTGKEIHRTEPVGFGGKTRIVYVRKRES